MKKLVGLFLVALFAPLLFVSNAFSGEPAYREFGNYKVYYSAFNSSFISPNIASKYDITRGKDKGLINIAVVPDEVEGGRAALITGYVSNIFQQRQDLEFFEVREGSVVYYLAPFRFENEDPLTFKISVKPHPNKPSYNLSFQRTFYHDD